MDGRAPDRIVPYVAAAEQITEELDLAVAVAAQVELARSEPPTAHHVPGLIDYPNGNDSELDPRPSPPRVPAATRVSRAWSRMGIRERLGLRPSRDPQPPALLLTLVSMHILLAQTGPATLLLSGLAREDAWLYRKYSFSAMPSEVPTFNLSDAQKVNNYGTADLDSPASLATETTKYIKHCVLDVNTNRGPSYNAPIQSTSVHSTKQVISGFMGFCHRFRGIPLADLRLSLFADPEHILSFVGFLRGRGQGTARQAGGWLRVARALARETLLPPRESLHLREPTLKPVCIFPMRAGDCGQEGQRLPGDWLRPAQSRPVARCQDGGLARHLAHPAPRLPFHPDPHHHRAARAHEGL